MMLSTKSIESRKTEQYVCSTARYTQGDLSIQVPYPYRPGNGALFDLFSCMYSIKFALRQNPFSSLQGKVLSSQAIKVQLSRQYTWLGMNAHKI